MPSIHISDEGTLRKMREVYVRDQGGALRKCKKVFINNDFVLRLVFESDVPPTPVDPTLVWTSAGAALRSNGKTTPDNTAIIRINYNGDVTASINNESVNTLHGQVWSSEFPVSDVFTDTWLVAINDLSTGDKVSFTSLSEGTSYTMSEDRTFNLANQIQDSTGHYNLEIVMDDQNGTIIEKPVSLWLPVGTPP